MSTTAGSDDVRAGQQTFERACANFVSWLDARVMSAGRGDGLDRLEVDPASRFWLGLLAPEGTVEKMQEKYGERGERLSPCAVGLRLRPEVQHGPWNFTVDVSCRGWHKDGADNEYPWRRSEPVRRTIPVSYDGPTEAIFGGETLSEGLTSAVGRGPAAHVRVSSERWQGRTELFAQVVNTSPQEPKPSNVSHHLYEVELAVRDLATEPFQLQSLPDSFRYDRNVPAYGHNCGVSYADGVFRTTDTVVVDRGTLDYGVAGESAPVLRFDVLADDPLPQLTALVDSFSAWVHATWSDDTLEVRAQRRGWTSEMLEAAREEAPKAYQEVKRLESGLELLHTDERLRRAFRLMNEAIEHGATRADGSVKYASWRPFQIAALLSMLPAVTGDPNDADVVDSVWFATGGGKTETYLGFLVAAALYERLSGRIAGITGWARFPLRMLSIQQTQRFANALAGAELMRRREGIGGDPISLGFFVGSNGTPNRVPREASKEGDVDVEDDTMPDRFQVLLECPFCHHDSIEMAFERRLWRLEHRCSRRDSGCPWPEDALPIFIADDEIYRFLPTVIVGTLDKAALMGVQASMAGFFGPPRGLCSTPGHGHVYAPRSYKPNGCLVPGCSGRVQQLPQPGERYGVSVRLQDELHLLRDSLGAVDSHYESLMDYVQQVRTGQPCKIIASSATLTGQGHQVETLFRREGRIFPQQGVSADESFWSRDADPSRDPAALRRRFVAVAPRGVTHDYVRDRTVEALQDAILELLREPSRVCAEAEVDPSYVAEVASHYGVHVVYGTTVRDVDAARRSLETEIKIGMALEARTLTGNTPFEEVRSILGRLEEPEPEYENRIHAIAASSMLSHGVDVERLNVMVMLGVPLTTAEFIQTTSRIGRRYPGLVYVLHRMGRERDAASFRQFESFVRHGDRFVDPVPVTRRSRRVLDISLPGIVEARRLLVHEPKSSDPLTTIQSYRKYLQKQQVTAQSELEEILEMLGFYGDKNHILRGHISTWLDRWEHNLEYPPPDKKFPNDVLPGGEKPMTSLRDVEPSAPMRD